MNKAELVAAIAAKTESTKKVAESVVNAFTQVVTEALKKGDRVIIPFPVSCGHCFFCEHQEFSQCDNTNEYGEAGGLLGYSKSYGDYRGGQAEYIRVPHANVGSFKVPDELTDEQVIDFCKKHARATNIVSFSQKCRDNNINIQKTIDGGKNIGDIKQWQLRKRIIKKN